MESKKDIGMAKTSTTPSESKSSDDNSSSESFGQPLESSVRELTPMEQIVENYASPTLAESEVDSHEMNSDGAGNTMNASGNVEEYVGIAHGISMRYNEARKGKQPCEETGKLGFGVYLSDVLNNNELIKIVRNSTEGRFLRSSGTMCRAVVRGKIQCIEEEDSAEKRAEKGIDFSDVGDKLRKGNNGSDGGTSRKVGRRPSPKALLSTGGAVSSNAPGHKPYTPLQRWQYENGLPVDRVDDVERWAVQVGLADDGDVDMPRNKKFKGQNNTEPPKYGTSTIRLTISSPEFHQSHLESTSGSDTDIEAESKAKDKGKEKM